MPFSTNKGIRGFPVSLCLLLIGFLFPAVSVQAADHFAFLPPSPAAGLYQVNNTYTFTVAAMSGGVTDTTFNNHGVTVGLYNTINPPLKVSDPGVTIVWNSTNFIGTAPVTFINGLLTFQMTYESGSDSEQVYIQDTGGSPLTTGDTYPGVFAGVIGGAAITVQGFPTNYYLEDANLDSTPASYPVSTDLLISQTDNATINFLDTQGSSLGVTVPPTGGVTGISGIDPAASSYAITNVTGGYAAGGRILLSHLYFEKSSNATSTPVTVEVILDYGAGGVTLSDYNNPRTNVDTVYLFRASDVAFPGFHLFNPAGAPVSNASFVSAPFNPFMTNGQIIVRIWAGNATNPVQVQYEDYQGNPNFLSSVNIPYSTQNVSPVKATVAPATVLSNSNPVTLTYTITNQYSSALTQITYQIPPNYVGGTDWSFNTPVTSPVFGHPGSSAVVNSNPSGTAAPGTITVNFTGGSPMAVNEAVTLQMIGIATSESNSWPISLLTAISTSGNAPIDPSVPIVKTLGVPSAPGGLTAVPINFNSGGGSVSLSWTQPVTNESPTSYILTGAQGGPVTIAGIGTTTYTDNTAINLFGYNYSLRSYNGVGQSPPANVGPVTAYVNPNAPAPVTALTAGTSIQLNWAAAVSAPGSYAVTGYQIWRDTQASMATASAIVTVGGTTYNDTTASAVTQYFYGITSLDSQYSSGAPGAAHISGYSSPIVSGFPPGNPPSAAVSLIFPGGSTPSTIVVSWTPPANVLNTPIANYVVYRAQATTITTGYAAYATVGGAVTSINDFNSPTTFSSGNSYGYYVVAVDSKGVTSNPSNSVTQGVGPSAPTGFVVASQGTTSISFIYNSNPPVEGVVNYILNRDGVGPVTTSATLAVTDTTMSYGVNHTYYLTAADSGPVTGPHSVTLTAALKPNAPTGEAVSYIYGSNSVSLTWVDPDANLLNYVLYRQINGGGYGGLTSPAAGSVSYVDAAPASAGSTVSYVLLANNIAGYSVTFSTPAGLQVPPNPPTGLTDTASSAAITLNWVPNAGTEKVSQYKVYRIDPSIPSTVVAGTTTGAVSTLADSGVVSGKNYQYYVTATNPGGGGFPGGESLASASVTTALLLGPPSSLTATVLANNTSVALTWTAPAASGDLTGYNVLQGTTNNFASSVTLASLAAAILNYTDSSPTTANAGVTYFYWVQGVNSGGGGATILNGVQLPPNPPKGLTSSSTTALITLNWTANPALEKVSIYSIYRSTNPVGGFVSIGKATSPAVTFNDGSAVSGTNYYYYLTATNPGGGGFPGGESLASASVTAALLLGPPSSLTATVLANNTSVALTWTAPAVSSNLTGYNVLQGTTNNFASSVTLASLAAAILNYTDSSPTTANAGVTYFYWVQGINGSGGGVTILRGVQLPPNPPTGLGAAPTTNTIPVTWASNPAPEAVAFYTLYRGTSPNPTVVLANNIVGTSYTDNTALLSGTNYYYRLTATNTGVTIAGSVTILGGTSNYSAGITSGLAPQTPSNLAVSLLDTSNDIGVTWTDVTIADANVTAVTLFTNTSPVTNAAALSNITPLNTTAVTQLAQSTDTTYYYWLQTSNPYGSSALAGPISKLTYPAAVSLMPVTLAVDNVSAILQWTTLPPDVTQYLVYRQKQGDSFILVQTVPAPPSFPVTLSLPATPGNVYNYKIVAVNATGPSPDSNIQSFGSLPSKPSAVTAVSGVSSAGVTVNLSWSDPTTLAEGVTAFTVYRSPNSNATTATYAPVTTGCTSLSYLDGAVTGTGIYYYIVAADDALGGESLLSTANAVAVTAFELPSAPGGFMGNAGPAAVTLTWSAAVSTTYTIASYNIDRLNLTTGVTTVLNTAATAFTDSSGLTNGVTYVYFLQAVDSRGNLSPPSASVTATPLQPPGPPTSVGVGVGDQELEITWNAGTAGTYPIAAYQVYRSVPGPLTLLATVGPTVTGYLNTGLTDGTTYSYYVVSVDSNPVTTALDISVNSNVGTNSPQPGVVNPPSALSAAAGLAQVTLAWSDSITVGGGAAVTGYTVFQSTTQASGYVSIGTYGPGNSPKIYSGLINGSTYYYYMVAYSGTGGISANSATVFGTPSAPPPAPAPVSVLDGSAQAVLSWGKSVPTAPITILNYKVIETLQPAGPPVTFTTSAAVTTYTDNPLTNSQTYIYNIAAVNSNNIWSVLSLPVTSYPYKPFAPTGLAFTSGTTGVTLTFTPPASSSWGVTEYSVIRTPLGGGTPVTILGSGTPISDNTGSSGQLYVYTIASMDPKGHLSAPSNPVTAVTGVSPAAPGNFIVSAGDHQNLIDWQPSAPVTNGPPVSYYILTDTNTPGGAVTLPATQTWYLDTGLGAATSANYSIQAVDATYVTIGNDASALVGPVNGTTSTSNLNPPTALTATANGPATIQLAWAAPNDMGKVVGSYYLFRSTSFIGGYTKIATLANPPAAPVTSYNDLTVSPGTTYYYLLQAYYTLPLPATASPNSNHAFTTTPGLPPPPKVIASSTMVFDANILLPLTGKVLTITYVPPSTGSVEIDIYSISGNIIRTLNPGTATADTPTVTTWDGKDRNGQLVASGVYFVEIKAPGFHLVKKVAVVK